MLKDSGFGGLKWIGQGIDPAATRYASVDIARFYALRSDYWLVPFYG
ncbi:MAG TPA: hypothetical protein VEZ50_20490 [Nodosilinea sp.]|nr:hypothetical protein [Nodosilinea sp.]